MKLTVTQSFSARNLDPEKVLFKIGDIVDVDDYRGKLLKRQNVAVDYVGLRVKLPSPKR